MGRRAQPKKVKANAKPSLARTSPQDRTDKVLDLEKRLAEALKREAEGQEQQAATSEILRIIASSPTDLRPVFDAMAESAARLCSAYDASIFQRDGDVLRLVAHHGPI